MNKKAFLIFCSLAILVVGGLWFYCMPSNLKKAETSPAIAPTTSIETMALEKVYEAIIDKVLEQDPSFNENATYLAIDTSMLISLNASQKSTLTKSLEKYNLTVLDLSFSTLQDQGYITDLIFKDGIFLQIEEEVVDENHLTIYPSKWRSTTQHMGYSSVEVKKQNDAWGITHYGAWWHM